MVRLIFLFLLLCTCSLKTEEPLPNLIRAKIVKKTIIKIKPDKSLKKYLRANFFVAEYEDPDIDLTQLDASVTSIPFITAIIPVIWAAGSNYSIETMDKDLFYALKKIKKVFKQFYPSLSWSGKLIPGKLIKNSINQPIKKLGILFSGGLDAVASCFHYFAADQLLITIGGSDVKYYQKSLWQKIKKQNQKFAQTYQKSISFIRSNFTSFIKGKLLKQLSSELPQWWALTSQSLGYTGLTAPLLHHYGIQHLIIGSSHTADLPMPYGTHPLIDNEINFADSTVYHDLGNLDRAEKIKLLCKKSKQYNVQHPNLRVCWGKDKNGGNCCECEKCLRTINELLIMNKNPQKFGFAINTDTAIKKTKEFLQVKQNLKARQLWHWECVQKQIIYSKKQFDLSLTEHFEWLSNLQLENLAKSPFDLKSWKEQDQNLAILWNESIKKRPPIH